MRVFESVGIGIPRVLLPQKGTDLSRWAVIACDQFTSEPEYWKKVEGIVGDSPSTLNLIFPEVYLGRPDADERIRNIRMTMTDYTKKGLFEDREGFIYVERSVGNKKRRGILACMDLEKYDYRRGAQSLIRATEGTILERLPPRVKIREGAPLELPHIMILVDDPEDTVFGPLEAGADKLDTLYDFDLMMDSGHLRGALVRNQDAERGVVSALENLADPGRFEKAYGLESGSPVLLFAMGDGNHSLATAKAIWEKTKQASSSEESLRGSPLRYALAEIVNLHDPALIFEPIHRVVFDVAREKDIPSLMANKGFEVRRTDSLASLEKEVETQKGLPQKIGLISSQGYFIAEVSSPESNLPVGSLQNFLDSLIKEKGAREVDYVHGTEAAVQLGSKPGNVGFTLPAMDKNDLFKTVMLDGALPRKTFSMGDAREKRFYMEARSLVEG